MERLPFSTFETTLLAPKIGIRSRWRRLRPSMSSRSASRGDACPTLASKMLASAVHPLPYNHAPAADSRPRLLWRPHGEFRFRPDAGGALCRSRARLRPQAVPQQDRALLELRCRREAAPRADAGVLRLLRLAFLRPRALAAGPPGAPVRSEARPAGAEGG